jgi:DNA/RNA endonuclease YhcR with UshA esterase domain
MEENGLNEDQIEPIIQDFAAYCFRRNVSYDTVIKSGLEVLYLEEKYEIPVEKIPELITQGKGTIDKLEARLEILRQKQHELEELDAIRQERDSIVAELEKYRQEIPSIKRIRELEAKLNEAKKSNEYYETHIIALEKELRIVGLEAMRSEGERIEADGRCESYRWQLSRILDKEDKLRQKK